MSLKFYEPNRQFSDQIEFPTQWCNLFHPLSKINAHGNQNPLPQKIVERKPFTARYFKWIKHPEWATTRLYRYEVAGQNEEAIHHCLTGM